MEKQGLKVGIVGGGIGGVMAAIAIGKSIYIDRDGLSDRLASPSWGKRYGARSGITAGRDWRRYPNGESQQKATACTC